MRPPSETGSLTNGLARHTAGDVPPAEFRVLLALLDGPKHGHRAAIRTLPSDFRDEYGEAMLDEGRVELEDAASRGLGGVPLAMARLAGDFATTWFREWGATASGALDVFLLTRGPGERRDDGRVPGARALVLR